MADDASMRERCTLYLWMIVAWTMRLWTKVLQWMLDWKTVSWFWNAWPIDCSAECRMVLLLISKNFLKLGNLKNWWSKLEFSWIFIRKFIKIKTKNFVLNIFSKWQIFAWLIFKFSKYLTNVFLPFHFKEKETSRNKSL